MVSIRKAKEDIYEWLAATARNVTPNGKSLNRIERIADGAVIVIHYGGSQHFGSGGYSAGSLYAGNEPEFVKEEESRRTSFVYDYYAKFRFHAPSVVYTYSGDTIGGGRSFGRFAYVCATDEQIEEAKRIVAERRRREAETADLTPLKEYLKQEWEADREHALRYRRQGACWCGGGSHRESSTYWEKEMLSENKVDESKLARLPAEVAAGIRKACREGIGPQVLKEAREEFYAKLKAAGKAFAQKRHAELVDMGFSPRTAARIMRAAGPGRALEAVEWAYQALEAIGSVDALDMVLSGLGGTNGFGKARTEAALEALGIPVPYASSSTALFAILRGAHAALLAGLPAREPAVTEET